MKIDVKVITKEFYEEYELPSHSTIHSAGIDLRSATFERRTIWPGETTLLPTGLIFAVPESVVMLLVPRSGLGHKHGIVLGNLVGVIDPDYRGEVMVSVWNRGDIAYIVEPGERICQALFVPFKTVELNQVAQLPETARAEGGFGSTGAE
jgi:dUTP pyrophosphatase